MIGQGENNGWRTGGRWHTDCYPTNSSRGRSSNFERRSMRQGKGKKRNAFTELVDKVGELETTVLASAHPYPAPSSGARQLAQRMVGAVSTRATSEARVNRVAALLDDLFAADANAQMKPKRRHAG